MKKVTDLRENEVIHCPTEREAIAICELMHEAGLKWGSGGSYLDNTNWEHYKEETFYRPKSGTYADIEAAKAESYTIHPASDFLPESFYQETPTYFTSKTADPNSFESLVTSRMFEVSNILLKKRDEYATNESIYINFEQTKDLSFVETREMIAWELMSKQLNSIKQFCAGRPHTKELLAEKMNDVHAYLLLIEGMLTNTEQ